MTLVLIFHTTHLAHSKVLEFSNNKLTNNRTDRPTDLFLTLDKLSLVSRHHRLEALPGQFSTAEKAANVVQIGWQERLTVHYRVIELEVESKTCLLSGCSFSEDADSTTKECVATGATNYLCLERACETFDVSQDCM